MLLMYAGGIAAISADNYKNLLTVLMTKVGSRHSGRDWQPIIVPTVEGILDVDRANLFKSLPDYQRRYTPRSDYLFKTVQPILDDLLFLGTSYEHLFDRFEILYALILADCRFEERNGEVWGPPGRFGWKFIRDDGPFDELLSEANQQKQNWALLRAGFFQGSYERFSTIAQQYREMLRKLHWW